MVYVRALGKLGLDMARAVPKELAKAAIPPLTETPTSNLLVGDFSAGTTTKERTLNHSKHYSPAFEICYQCLLLSSFVCEQC